MENIAGQEIVLGLYKINAYFNLETLELYIVQEKEGKLIAIDMNGNSFSIEDPGFYDRRRNPTSSGALDCFDLISIGKRDYTSLKTKLIKSQKRVSKLLQMLENHKPNLSELPHPDAIEEKDYNDHVNQSE